MATETKQPGSEDQQQNSGGEKKQASKGRQPRNVPKPQFTDAEAGALEFPSSDSRAYNYFEPARQRASVYEDVTVDVQPDPARHLTQGWVYGFADRDGGYPAEWTALKSTDWHAFRDPNGEWEKTIYQNNAAVVRQNSQNIANAQSENVFVRWTDEWKEVVEKDVSAWMHPEHGLGMHVFIPAQRDAPTNMINNAISVNSMHKLRFAQDIAMYNLAITDTVEGFDGQAHMAAWQEDPKWQGVRENAENLTAIRDWAEAVVAANLVFEPLVGELFRGEFVMHIAASNGDFVTPTLMGLGESDFERDLGYTKVLLGLLVEDKEHGDANKELLSEWLAKYVPMSIAAIEPLEPMWSHAKQNGGGPSYEESVNNVKERAKAIYSELELQAPKEL